MKKLCVYLIMLLGAATYGQQFSSDLVLAVKQNKKCGDFRSPDFSYYTKNYNTVFREYDYTFNLQEAYNNKVYVASNAYYSGTYIPVVAQQHNTNLGTNNIYYYNVNAAQSAFDKPIGVDLSKINR